MGKVKALRDFQSGQFGTRAKGDEFTYPVTEDPAGLLRDGFVEKVAAPAPKPDKPAG